MNLAKNVLYLFLIITLTYYAVKINLYIDKKGDFLVDFLLFMLYMIIYYIPTLAFLLSIFFLYYYAEDRPWKGVMLFLLFYIFPALYVISNIIYINSAEKLILDSYFVFWEYNSSEDFRLEYLIMLVVASSFFIVFLFQQIQIWRKR